ncbi:MAG TPA: DUF58 domain-containing protein, partial [Ktedonobacterales bacterium]|nr:DUF58 domain-containing protein [Ktedonobacterales bacterium]
TQLVIENRKPLPLSWVEIEDEFPERLPVLTMAISPYSQPERALVINTLSLWAYQRVRRHYRVWAVERGVYSFGPTKLQLSDPFGVLTRTGESDAHVTMLVHPLITSIERFGLSPRAPFGERKATQRLLEDPLRTIGVRDYQVGDDPRRIHWQATARMGRLQSKMFEPSARHTLMIFLDTRTYTDPTIGYDPPRVELAISAAASVAVWGLEQGYAVGLISNGTLGASELDEIQMATASPLDTADAPMANSPEHAVGAISAPGNTPQQQPSLSAEELDQRLQRAAARLRLRIPPSARPEQATLVLDGLARLLPYYGAEMSQLVSGEQHRLPTGSSVVFVGAESVMDVPTIVALRQARSHGYAVSLMLTTTEPATGETPTSVAQGKSLLAASEATSEDTAEASRHVLHLADLPTRYIGGRTRWRELTASALGVKTRRLATTTPTAEERARELRLLRASQAASAIGVVSDPSLLAPPDSEDREGAEDEQSSLSSESYPWRPPTNRPAAAPQVVRR